LGLLSGVRFCIALGKAKVTQKLRGGCTKSRSPAVRAGFLKLTSEPGTQSSNYQIYQLSFVQISVHFLIEDSSNKQKIPFSYRKYSWMGFEIITCDEACKN
jgi:hypothetical protein